MDPNTLCERGIILAGDPESCIRGVQLYEEAGVDQVILITQTETIPHERVLQSIEMFGKHVIPACRTETRPKPVPAGASGTP
jgi:alkanesulfonate monooxygenase SsuD/methylene tetrahydromethanopterin reductase-like flavin-dependent oxidoreductase (luciferase family)